MGIKAASYFWMFSALCAWWRVTVYLVEEAYGPGHAITKFFPIGRTAQEQRAPLVMPGLGGKILKDTTQERHFADSNSSLYRTGSQTRRTKANLRVDVTVLAFTKSIHERQTAPCFKLH